VIGIGHAQQGPDGVFDLRGVAHVFAGVEGIGQEVRPQPARVTAGEGDQRQRLVTKPLVDLLERLRIAAAAEHQAQPPEKEKGMIAPWMLADLTLIDQDLRKIPGPEIRKARVTRTVIGGKTVFQK
jgi:predicted amidohydrolase YtcJ